MQLVVMKYILQFTHYLFQGPYFFNLLATQLYNL